MKETKVDYNPVMRINKTMILALVSFMVRLYSTLVRDKVRRKKEESGFCKKTLVKLPSSPQHRFGHLCMWTPNGNV